MSVTVYYHQNPLKLKLFNAVYVLYSYCVYINGR